MIRIVRVAALVLAAALCGPAAALAQSGPSDTSPFYAQFDVAATLGHKSSGAVGGEGGYRVKPYLDAFLEAGHIGNAASADLEAGANTIANNVGATASSVSKVTYFDLGVRYHRMVTPTIQWYGALGLGAAKVSNETTFSVNGTVFPPEALGISGSDLNGHETKTFLMLGGGATMTFGRRYFGDLSYRFGGVLGASNQVTGNGYTLKTNRIQLGIGMRFNGFWKFK